MTRNTRMLTHGALIAALYAALSYLQNLLLPGSATSAIQFRIAEALCVLAFFTPAAIPGLSVGCLLFNAAFAGSLPLDFLVGPAASAVSAWVMWLLRRRPAPGFFAPALVNGLFIGWELWLFAGGGFLLNSLYVAAGEAAVLLTLGVALYTLLRRNRVCRTLFAGDG